MSFEYLFAMYCAKVWVPNYDTVMSREMKDTKYDLLDLLESCSLEFCEILNDFQHCF